MKHFVKFFLLQIQKAEILYWKVDNPELFTPDKLPWLASEIGSEHYYVFPICEYPGLIKVIHDSMSYTLLVAQTAPKAYMNLRTANACVHICI